MCKCINERLIAINVAINKFKPFYRDDMIVAAVNLESINSGVRGNPQMTSHIFLDLFLLTLIFHRVILLPSDIIQCKSHYCNNDFKLKVQKSTFASVLRMFYVKITLKLSLFVIFF